MMSALYIGSTGLKTHSEGMSVIGNNISNTNTVGFKKSLAVYADLSSQSVVASSNGITNFSQVGQGSSVGDIRKNFSQGGFQATSNSTDLAINGKGFFGVEHDGKVEYTRAGNFNFNYDGHLIDPSGWNVLGYKVDKNGESTTTSPVQLDPSQTIPAKASTEIIALSQLGKLSTSTTNNDNPYFALASAWDGTSSTPLSTGQYSYSQNFSFYDENGKAVSGKIYFDKASEETGKKIMEYVVALDPSNDGSSLAETKAAGLLMAGTLTFDAVGKLTNMTAFTPPSSGDPTSLSEWKAADLQNGFPSMSVTPEGGATQKIALNMGMTLTSADVGRIPTAAEAKDKSSILYEAATGGTLLKKSSNTYGNTNVSILNRTDGYAEGALKNIQISSDGMITGRYSNGETMDLYRIPVYNFVNEDGLVAEGGNHFSAPSAVGTITEGIPGTKNFGSLSSLQLEASNVDLASEMTSMIVNQRGFQMNSKVITTCDTMLQKALELKRT